jgi:hypothetical protein
MAWQRLIQSVCLTNIQAAGIIAQYFFFRLVPLFSTVHPRHSLLAYGVAVCSATRLHQSILCTPIYRLTNDQYIRPPDCCEHCMILDLLNLR